MPLPDEYVYATTYGLSVYVTGYKNTDVWKYNVKEDSYSLW